MLLLAQYIRQLASAPRVRRASTSKACSASLLGEGRLAILGKSVFPRRRSAGSAPCLLCEGSEPCVRLCVLNSRGHPRGTKKSCCPELGCPASPFTVALNYRTERECAAYPVGLGPCVKHEGCEVTGYAVKCLPLLQLSDTLNIALCEQRQPLNSVTLLSISLAGTCSQTIST